MAVKQTGGKKTDNLTVRFEPKLRYLAELAAKSQKRSLSAFVEWAVEMAIQDVTVRDKFNEQVKLSEIDNAIWDVDEIDRFIKLAVMLPDLLTFDEQVLWKCINKYPFLFSHSPFVRPFNDLEDIKISKVTEYWDDIQKASNGATNSIEVLAKADKVLAHGATPPSSPMGRFEDDIPF